MSWGLHCCARHASRLRPVSASRRTDLIVSETVFCGHVCLPGATFGAVDVSRTFYVHSPDKNNKSRRRPALHAATPLLPLLPPLGLSCASSSASVFHPLMGGGVSNPCLFVVPSCVHSWCRHCHVDCLPQLHGSLSGTGRGDGVEGET